MLPVAAVFRCSGIQVFRCATVQMFRFWRTLYAYKDNVDYSSKCRERTDGQQACADGGLYLHGENNEVALVEAAPDGFHEKGHFTPPNGPTKRQERAWAYPVVSNGRLYIRDLGTLWCYDVKGK